MADSTNGHKGVFIRPKPVATRPAPVLRNTPPPPPPVPPRPKVNKGIETPTALRPLRHADASTSTTGKKFIHTYIDGRCATCGVLLTKFQGEMRCPHELVELGLKTVKVHTICYSKDTTIQHDLTDILPNGMCRPHHNQYQAAYKKRKRAEAKAQREGTVLPKYTSVVAWATGAVDDPGTDSDTVSEVEENQ